MCRPQTSARSSRTLRLSASLKLTAPSSSRSTRRRCALPAPHRSAKGRARDKREVKWPSLLLDLDPRLFLGLGPRRLLGLYPCLSLSLGACGTPYASYCSANGMLSKDHGVSLMQPYYFRFVRRQDDIRVSANFWHFGSCGAGFWLRSLVAIFQFPFRGCRDRFDC